MESLKKALKSKKVLIGLIIFVTLLIFALVYLVANIYTNDKPAFVPEETRGEIREGVNDVVVKPLEKVTPFIAQKIAGIEYKTSGSTSGASNTSEDPYKNWQTYKNEDLGFELKYPKGWAAQENQNVRFFESKYSSLEGEHSQIVVRFYENNIGLNLNQWVEANKELFIGDQEMDEVEGFYNRENFLVNGKDALKFQWNSMGEIKVVLVSLNGKVVIFEALALSGFENEKEFLNNFEKILNSM